MLSALVSLAPSLLTGVAALGGVYITNSMRRKDDASLRADNRSAERRAEAISRGEHLYLFLDKMRVILITMLGNNVKLLLDEISQEVYFAGKVELPGDFEEQGHKARFNIATFFPEALKDYEEWQKGSGTILNDNLVLVKKKLKGDLVSNEEIEDYRIRTSACINEIESIAAKVAKSCRTYQ